MNQLTKLSEATELIESIIEPSEPVKLKKDSRTSEATKLVE